MAAAQAVRCLPPHLDGLLHGVRGRIQIVGAGKAAAAMAQAVETAWAESLERIEGLVVVPHGQRLSTRRIELIEAAHPVPDAASEQAAARVLAAVQGLGEDDLVLVLLSGGASALLAAPLPGLSLAEKRAVTEKLLKSGADIGWINTVRKHLSRIKGGHLSLAAWPARVLTLAISDVADDDPATLGSGPTVPDPTTCAEALDICRAYDISLSPDVTAQLASGRAETPKPGEAHLARSEFRLVASGRTALAAAAEVARAHGYRTLDLGAAIEGEAREVARVMAGIARACKLAGTPVAPPCVLLSGGETTVTVKGRGRGGRNGEFLLALALALRGAPGIHALAADTDGIDGAGENAGAFVAPNTLTRARARGLDPRARLLDNDALAVFAALDDLLMTGPTQTNVNDFRAILIESDD